jgi:hypothetical protein
VPHHIQNASCRTTHGTCVVTLPIKQGCIPIQGRPHARGISAQEQRSSACRTRREDCIAALPLITVSAPHEFLSLANPGIRNVLPHQKLTSPACCHRLKRSSTPLPLKPKGMTCTLRLWTKVWTQHRYPGQRNNDVRPPCTTLRAPPISIPVASMQNIILRLYISSLSFSLNQLRQDRGSISVLCQGQSEMRSG